MCNRKPYQMSALDAQDIFSRVYANLRDLLDMGVQVGCVANGASVNVELSAYRSGAGLKTLGIVVFPADKDKKVAFIDGVIEALRHDNAYDVIVAEIKKYNSQFIY